MKLLEWARTLKFKIVVLCLLVSLVSAWVGAHISLVSSQELALQVSLKTHSRNAERSASLVSSRIDLLRLALGSVADQLASNALSDRAALLRHLNSKPAAAELFGSLFIADHDGAILASLHQDAASDTSNAIAERELVQRLLAEVRREVPRPVIGRVDGGAQTFLAMPVRAADASIIAVVAGTFELQSMLRPSIDDNPPDADGIRLLVVDGTGQILSHPNPERLALRADSEPGLASEFRHWALGGYKMPAAGTSVLSEGHVVAMAGAPASDLMVVQVMHQAQALSPLNSSRTDTWKIAALTGLVSAVVAGLLAIFMTRPISRLRQRAQSVLSSGELSSEDWSQGSSEVGALSEVLRQIAQQEQARRQETRLVLSKLQAVLDNASVGIAFTRNSCFEMVSRSFYSILGWEESTLEGQMTRVMYPSDEARDALVERARPAFESDGSFEGELTLARQNGETFWAHMRGRAVVTGDINAGTIWIIEDVTHAYEQRAQLMWSANHDALTGLVNRAAFDIRLGQATAKTAQHSYCALFIDLDRFKQLNDTAGHAAGDSLLRELATQFRAFVRDSDTVARLGGDEFAVLLNRCPAEKAQGIAENMRAAVDAYRLVWEGRSYSVGASIGMVYVDNRFKDSIEVMKAADAACYVAKRGGRNKVVVHAAETMQAA